MALLPHGRMQTLASLGSRVLTEAEACRVKVAVMATLDPQHHAIRSHKPSIHVARIADRGVRGEARRRRGGFVCVVEAALQCALWCSAVRVVSQYYLLGGIFTSKEDYI